MSGYKDILMVWCSWFNQEAANTCHGLTLASNQAHAAPLSLPSQLDEGENKKCKSWKINDLR